MELWEGDVIDTVRGGVGFLEFVSFGRGAGRSGLAFFGIVYGFGVRELRFFSWIEREFFLGMCEILRGSGI